MISDFKDGTGRYGNPKINGFKTKSLLYTDHNLIEGIYYSQWLMSDFKYREEPFLKYNLEKFIIWANKKLKPKDRVNAKRRK